MSDPLELLGMKDCVTGGTTAPRERPKLPDGSVFECEVGYQSLVDSLLESFLSGYQFKNRPEHTHILRMLLQMNVSAQRLHDQAVAEEKKGQPNVRQATAWRNQSLKTMESLSTIYQRLHLMQDTREDQDPQKYVDELRGRVRDFAKEHALERAYACSTCGTISMVYALRKHEFRPDWGKFRKQLLERGGSVELLAWLMPLLMVTPIPALGQVVSTSYTHPWLNDATMPIWSAVIRRMIEHDKCECGKPKLTIKEGAEILQISPDGFDQLLQERNKMEGKEAIPGSGIEAAESIFGDEKKGHAGGSATPNSES